MNNSWSGQVAVRSSLPPPDASLTSWRWRAATCDARPLWSWMKRTGCCRWVLRSAGDLVDFTQRIDDWCETWFIGKNRFRTDRYIKLHEISLQYITYMHIHTHTYTNTYTYTYIYNCEYLRSGGYIWDYWDTIQPTEYLYIYNRNLMENMVQYNGMSSGCILT